MQLILPKSRKQFTFNFKQTSQPWPPVKPCKLNLNWFLAQKKFLAHCCAAAETSNNYPVSQLAYQHKAQNFASIQAIWNEIKNQNVTVN